MRILALLTHELFIYSFGAALVDLGHELYYQDTADPYQLDHVAKHVKPDFVFDMGWDHIQSNNGPKYALADAIKRHNFYHVYFAEEDPLHFDYFSKHYVADVPTHFVLTRGANCVPKYEAMGMKSAFLDVGFNEVIHRPQPPDPNYACDVSVVANVQFFWDIFRRKCIANLVVPLFDMPYDIKVWGKEWEDSGANFGKEIGAGMHQGLLPFLETPHVYSSSKINICVQSVENQLSNRTYDILASGGFVLTADTPAVRERFKPGVHVEVSSSPEETREKV
ncbi:MAG: CgeB family protein, partial [Tumebacillaceae bacterium]